MAETVTKRIRVIGKVQGVGFRISARRKADDLGMHVVADNQDDGSMLTTATGTEEQVAQLIAWARTGPRVARVDDIQVS